jgi:cysteine desulfurase
VIYLDYHATTPVDRRVADRIYYFMTQEFGNASSVDHAWGDRAEAAVK